MEERKRISNASDMPTSLNLARLGSVVGAPARPGRETSSPNQNATVRKLPVTVRLNASRFLQSCSVRSDFLAAAHRHTQHTSSPAQLSHQTHQTNQEKHLWHTDSQNTRIVYINICNPHTQCRPLAQLSSAQLETTAAPAAAPDRCGMSEI